MRKIKIKATQRNTARVTKWLRLDQDFSGMFTSPYGNGYKLMEKDKMVYVFTSKK